MSRVDAVRGKAAGKKTALKPAKGFSAGLSLRTLELSVSVGPQCWEDPRGPWRAGPGPKQISMYDAVEHLLSKN